jgi:alpha-galactosidase
LDTSWYHFTKSWADGIGNWLSPDPAKFPAGVEEPSEQVCGLGMGFGLWHQIEFARHGTHMRQQYPDLYTEGHLRLDRLEGQEAVLTVLRGWIERWHLTWMHWESVAVERWAYDVDLSGKLTLAYTQGLYTVIDKLRKEFPDFYIAGCQGGRTKFDWGMAVRTHSTWLSDHTAHPDVCRYMWSRASRFWPAHYLNSAVRVHGGSSDDEIIPHTLLGRMVGTLSFNGDIAQWS